MSADKRLAVQLATQALNGSKSAILAARELIPLLVRLGVSRDDEIMDTMILILSETDTLPVGHERVEWAQDVLEAMAPEIARAEDWARETGTDAFTSVVQRWHSKTDAAAATEDK